MSSVKKMRGIGCIATLTRMVLVLAMQFYAAELHAVLGYSFYINQRNFIYE